MSQYYLAPFSKTLFENIVPPAKRSIKKNLTPTKIYAIQNKKTTKKYLLQADFRIRLKFYLAAINKTIAQKKSVIILVPDLYLIKYFQKYLKKYQLSIIHSGLTKTLRWQEFDKIRNSKIQIVIGSQSALFSPLRNLGLVILDQEENETYKNDRSPRFHAESVGEKLAELSGANLILGSLTPRIETYYQTISGNLILKSISPTKSLKNITIVDMNSEKYIISKTLENNIENELQKKQKVLLILNRKGEGTKFSCTDCGWISLCQHCGLPLIPQAEDNVCFRCQKKYPFPESCPKCQSVHLKPFGIGTSRLRKFLLDFFPQKKIIIIEKENDAKFLHVPWDIAIATNYALKFQFPRLGLVGVMDADQGLNFPDFHSNEKNFQNLYKFLKIGERGIIQTNLPESNFIRNLAKLDYRGFFLDEITFRQKFAFPPFARIIRLLYKNENQSLGFEETKRVFNELSKIKKTVYISSPARSFIHQKRDKFEWQIIIKTKSNLPPEIKKILVLLPHGWAVDVDPASLL